MRLRATRFLFGVLLVVASVDSARAEPIIVGAPGDSATCIPFGCRDVDRYQQVYAAGLFPGVFTISVISFPHTIDAMSNTLDPAQYDIRISTTSREVGQLSSVSLDSNVGSDSSVVYVGPLAGEVPRDTSLSFMLPVPFTFDPRDGNLLLDVVKRGGLFFGDDGVYLDSNQRLNGMSSSVWTFGNTSYDYPSFGLVTEFSGQAEPVPEPATMLLFATGAVIGTLRRHRTPRWTR